MCSRILAFVALLLASLPSSAQDPRVPPAVGTVATSVEPVRWLDAGSEGSVPEMRELRGQVVLVHTWGYYCGPCLRAGVPYVVDLMEAQRANGLRAYSITVPIQDDKPEDHSLRIGRQLGIQHPMGYSDGYGGMSAYVNMNVNRGLTWCFVIGREGGVRWAGDPSIDDEEFLEAVGRALREDPMPPLPEGLPGALDEAVLHYVAGELVRAADEAAKVVRQTRGDGDDAAAARAAAEELIRSIDGHRAELGTRLAGAFERRDPGAYLAAQRALLERFPRTDEAKRAAELDREAQRHAGFRAELERWSEWDELRREAPVLFPARVDADGKRFVKKLRRYVERAEEGAPGLEEARRWLAAASDA